MLVPAEGATARWAGTDSGADAAGRRSDAAQRGKRDGREEEKERLRASTAATPSRAISKF